MQTRKLGNSEIKVPVVFFGAWAIGGWYWGGSDDEQAVRAIHAAIESGITAIDTAPIYGLGHSETIVGRAIKDRREKVFLARPSPKRYLEQVRDGPRECRRNRRILPQVPMM